MKRKFDVARFKSLPTCTNDFIQLYGGIVGNYCYCAGGAALKCLGATDDKIMDFDYDEARNWLEYNGIALPLKEIANTNDFHSPVEAKELVLEQLKGQVEFINE